MREIGYSRLRSLSLGDVDDRDKKSIPTAELVPPAKGQDLDFGTIGFHVSPAAPGLIYVFHVVKRAKMDTRFVRRPHVLDAHCRKLTVGISVMPDCGIVDVQEEAGLDIEDPHRHRVIVEQQAGGLLARLMLRG